MESTSNFTSIIGPLKHVYSILNQVYRPFMVVAKATNKFLKAPVTVRLDNKSDLVLLDVSYHTVVGCCTNPGRYPILRPDTSDKLMFTSPDGRPSNCGYIIFELRESNNKLSESLRHYAIVGWRTSRFQSKPRVIVHIYHTEPKYSLCTTPDLIQAQCNGRNCRLSSLCDTKAQSTITTLTGKHYTVNVAISDVLPAIVNIEISEESHPMPSHPGYFPSCRGYVSMVFFSFNYFLTNVKL
jgi:hypothetical protein